MIDAQVEVMGEPPNKDLAFLHAIMAQCSLPYRQLEANQRDYVRESGRASIIISAGHLLDPITRKPTLQGVPYGAKPRLLMIHLCTEAVRTKSPTISVGDSMSSLMRDLGLTVSGGKNGSISRFKEQLNRLAACRMQLIMRDDDRASIINPAPLIKRLDLWFPPDSRQRMLWPSQLTLSDEFFQSLTNFALPLDPRAIRGLQHSARAIDAYTWLAHRLPRVKNRKGDRVSWSALQTQFGPEVSDLRNFKSQMITALKQVTAVYPDARIEQVDGGLLLKRSNPPIKRKEKTRQLSTKSRG